jgi:hypothetical protein
MQCAVWDRQAHGLSSNVTQWHATHVQQCSRNMRMADLSWCGYHKHVPPVQLLHLRWQVQQLLLQHTREAACCCDQRIAGCTPAAQA